MSALIRVNAVNVYGVGPVRTLPIPDAIDFVTANGGSDKLLVLGAMQPGYLGRQMLSLDDLRALLPAKCRMCPRDAETRVVYEVPRKSHRPRVEHLTCGYHTQPLEQDMVEAGWTVVERAAQ
jgi:hypothetical protein